MGVFRFLTDIPPKIVQAIPAGVVEGNHRQNDVPSLIRGCRLQNVTQPRHKLSTHLHVPRQGNLWVITVKKGELGLGMDIPLGRCVGSGRVPLGRHLGRGFGTLHGGVVERWLGRELGPNLGLVLLVGLDIFRGRHGFGTLHGGVVERWLGGHGLGAVVGHGVTWRNWHRSGSLVAGETGTE